MPLYPARSEITSCALLKSKAKQSSAIPSSLLWTMVGLDKSHPEPEARLKHLGTPSPGSNRLQFYQKFKKKLTLKQNKQKSSVISYTSLQILQYGYK